MANGNGTILTAEEEMKLRQPIEDYVGRIQEKIDRLREDGTDKVLSLQNHIDSIRRDRILTKQEKETKIAADQSEMQKAKSIEAKNKDEISKLIADAEAYLNAHFEKDYYQTVKIACQREKAAAIEKYRAKNTQLSQEHQAAVSKLSDHQEIKDEKYVYKNRLFDAKMELEKGIEVITLTEKDDEDDEIIKVAQLSVEDALKELNTEQAGLTIDEVHTLQQTYGKNVFAKAKQEPLWKKFIANFTSLMAILLWVAGIIAFCANLVQLGIAIWAVNIINGIFSFWQEFQADKATEALANMLPSYTRVVRNGKEEKILAKDLVPGDIVKLEEGDDIPADIRVIAATSAQVDQSSLTGEVNPVHKDAHRIENVEKKNHADLNNMIFSGTNMMKGNVTGAVVKTGMNTDFGKIAELTQNVKQQKSPLEKELDTLTKQISILAISIGIIFFLVATFFVHYPLVKAFVFALGMIVAFIPEGLEPTVTLSLAGAVQRMAKKHALIKRLSSVETLGSTSVICSDKTGTLTKNEMTVKELWTLEKSYHVSGEGYAVRGHIKEGPTHIFAKDNDTLKEVLLGGVFADNARIQKPDKQHPRYQILGDPTEACLEVVARKGKIDVEAEVEKTPRVKELPFDSSRKMMTVIQSSDGTHRFNTYTKGAPNCVVDKCTSYLCDGKIQPITQEIKDKIMRANDGYAKDGLRVLAVAGRNLDQKIMDNLDLATIDTVERDLTFLRVNRYDGSAKSRSL